MRRKRIAAALLLAMSLLSACGGDMQPTPAEELNTPKYDAVMPDTVPVFAPNEVHTSEDGIVVITPPGKTEESTVPASDIAEPAETELVSPETVWEADNTATYHAFTLPDKAALDESGCIGVLSIPAIDLSLNVYESEDEMEAMKHGAAHYKDTSAWDGNCGISAHNGGVPLEVSFANLHKLQKGDTLTYTTALGERSYTVTEIREIADDDWSWLARSADNRLTMTTCISGKPDKRLMVQAVAE